MDGRGETLNVDSPTTARRGSEPLVSVRGLVKSYGRREAVRGIDLEVHSGEIFAFLGPNGAGKTTTTFPPLITSIRRALAKRRPYRCPTCGTQVDTH